MHVGERIHHGNTLLYRSEIACRFFFFKIFYTHKYSVEQEMYLSCHIFHRPHVFTHWLVGSFVSQKDTRQISATLGGRNRNGLRGKNP